MRRRRRRSRRESKFWWKYDFKLSVKKFKYQHRQTCSIKLCKICIQRLHGLDLFSGPFQLLEALSLVLIGCSFWVQRNLPPKKRKENSHREREREREIALQSKGTPQSCPGQTHPQTPLLSKWLNHELMHLLCVFTIFTLSLSLSTYIYIYIYKLE